MTVSTVRMKIPFIFHPSRRGYASARKIFVALGTERQSTPVKKNDKRYREEIRALLSLGSLDAACVGLFWISHRLNCETLALSAFLPPRRFEECLANGWQLVPSPGTIPRAARAAFCFGEVELENGKSSVPLLHRRGNGASRFQSCSALPRTLRHRTTTLDFPPWRFRYAICPRRLLFLPAAI